MNRCLFCYEPVEEGCFHVKCSKKIFGAENPPLLPYTEDTMRELAKEIVRNSISVPGVQAKLSLHLSAERGGSLRFTLVGLWGNYILKPPVSAYPHIPEIEDCTMHLAEIFRIPTVPHSLILLDSGRGKPAYIARRIDRNLKTNQPVHMEDFCQLSGKLTEDKYRGSLEGCVKIIRRYSSNTLLDIVGFFEIALFSFISGNADMHLKNFSLIYTDEGCALAPAYDLLSTRLLIPEKLDREEFALTMNGKKRNFTKNDFLKFGESGGLSSKQMENCFKKFSASKEKALNFIRNSFIPPRLREHYCRLLESRAERLRL